MGYRREGTAAGRESPMEVTRKRGEGDGAQAREQHGLCLPIGLLQRGVDRLLHQTTGAFFAVPYGQQLRGAHGFVDVTQRDVLQRTRQEPPAPVPFGGSDEAGVPQAGHQAANDHGVGLHGLSEPLRGCGSAKLGHVKQAVEDA